MLALHEGRELQNQSVVAGRHLPESNFIVAIFYPFSQFCEIIISLLSLQTQPNTAPNLFQRGAEYGKYVPESNFAIGLLLEIPTREFPFQTRSYEMYRTPKHNTNIIVRRISLEAAQTGPAPAPREGRELPTSVIICNN